MTNDVSGPVPADNAQYKNENTTKLREDYEFSRVTYYEIIEHGKTAIAEALEVAQGSEHPRAYEVLSKLLKDVADVADKLMDLNKKRKDIEEPAKQNSALPPGASTLTNNVFVGSTSDLQRMLAPELYQMLNAEKEIGPSVASGNIVLDSNK